MTAMHKQTYTRQATKGSSFVRSSDGSTANENIDHYTYEDTTPSAVDDTTLVAANQKLANLPLDDIPDPASLPEGSRMPLRRNRFFVGRGNELRALATSLRAGDVTAVGQVEVAAATGLGGIGKTQLASEFVHRYGQYFEGGVFWLSLADANTVPSEVADCGRVGRRRLNLPNSFDSLDTRSQVIEVMSAWQSKRPCLLVFDNCEDDALLDRWLPRTGGCRVLVTSRREQWEPRLVARTVKLDVLSRQESVALLREYRPDLPADDQDLNTIAEELGDLPLALELAGSFLKEYHFERTPEDYVKELRSPDVLQHISLIEGNISLTGHEQNVARTFALSYERLETTVPIDRLAIRLLARSVHFSPGEPIPRDLLKATLPLPEDDQDEALLRERALRRLTELGLLQTHEKGTLTLHRLLAAFVRGTVNDAEAQPAVEKALAKTAEDLFETGRPEPLFDLLPHLRALTDAAKEREDSRAAALCEAFGRCLRDAVGVYAEARPYLKRAVEVNEHVRGEEHPRTADSLNSLASLLDDQGYYAEAKPLYQRALAIREKRYGENHRDTAASINNLALLLQNQGLFEEARSMYERALVINEGLLGKEHYIIAHNLNNLASILHDQGYYAEAKRLYQRALAIYETAVGKEHPYNASTLTNLGLLLQEEGSYQEALPLLQRALAIYETTYGEEHPRTADGLNSLASLLKDWGRDDEALPLYERALAIREKTLGFEDPDTAISLNDLAGLFSKQQKYDQALPLLQRALAIYETTYGEEHPRTADGLNSLASLLKDWGRDDEALPLYERALAIREKVNGKEHLYTGNVLVNLAYLRSDQGHYDEALSMFQRALAIREKVYGEEHFDTANSLVDLANVLTIQEEYDQALPLVERALDIYSKVYNEEHLRTDTARQSYGGAWSVKGSILLALRRYEEALEAYDKSLSLDTDVAVVWQNKAFALQELGRSEEALEAYDKSLSLDTDVAVVWQNKAFALQGLGRGEEALESLHKAMSLS